MLRQPPRKKKGQGKGDLRAIGGALLGVHEAGGYLGITEKMVYARVARRQIPFKKWGGRIVFVRKELEAFIEKGLDGGCSVDEALQNLER